MESRIKTLAKISSNYPPPSPRAKKLLIEVMDNTLCARQSPCG
jgi:hypothetical protein